MTNPEIKNFAERADLKFKNPSLLETAFVHRSYLNENKRFELENNERFEFLGDAVLELAVTKYLFDNFKKPEGELTAIRSALVRGKNLSEIAESLNIFEYLFLSSGEKAGSPKARGLILANCLEAIIGAIYLDRGFGAAEKFVKKYIIDSKIDEIMEKHLYIDAKSYFQEKTQEGSRVTPVYQVLSESGPDHDKKFISGVFVADKLIARGEGDSKNTAEQEAAREAIVKLSL